MCYYTDNIKGKNMRLLRVAVENKRWDLAAHTIILATATILSNGHKTGSIKGKQNSLSLKSTAVKRINNRVNRV